MQKTINLNWIKNTNVREEITNGIRPKQNEIRTIFYCYDSSSPANFELPLSFQFDESEPRCYRAYILNYFGK